MEKARNNPDVILAGSVTEQERDELFSYAGLFVIPSLYEGLPIVLLEAMSFGLPCIASDIPPHKEVSLNEERLFSVGSIDDLTQHIENLFSKPLTEDERSKQIDRVRGKYNWERIADSTLLLYRELLS